VKFLSNHHLRFEAWSRRWYCQDSVPPLTWFLNWVLGWVGVRGKSKGEGESGGNGNGGGDLKFQI